MSSTIRVITDLVISSAAGATVGAGALAGAFSLLGLTIYGPIAGGLFAQNMGAGLVSGSLMSILQ